VTKLPVFSNALSMSEKREILEVCQRLHERGWLAACDGNISYRTDSSIIMTPSGRHKGFIKESDLTEVTIENEVLKGTPSSERLMHLAIYQHCPKAKAVVHAHPPIAIAWTIAQPEMKELPAECISELILAVGAIPVVPYARPGTQDMGNVLLPFIPKHRAMILARHGAVAWGETLEEAYYGIERLEHSAKILFYAKALGGLTMLPPEEVNHLREMRARGTEKIL